MAFVSLISNGTTQMGREYRHIANAYPLCAICSGSLSCQVEFCKSLADLSSSLFRMILLQPPGSGNLLEVHGYRPGILKIAGDLVEESSRFQSQGRQRFLAKLAV